MDRLITHLDERKRVERERRRSNTFLASMVGYFISKVSCECLRKRRESEREVEDSLHIGLKQYKGMH